MGMVIGGFLFALAALKWESLARTAHHCFVLALIFVVPTAIAGIMDWQHRFHGEWESLIAAKIVMACILTVLLALAVFLWHRGKVGPKGLLVLYLLCLVTTIGLGFTGGELLYG